MARYTFKDIFSLVKTSAGQFMENNSFRLAAALAYNTIFSLPPLLYIVIATAGYFFGEKAVTGQLYEQLDEFIGHDAALQLEEALKSVKVEGGSTMATWIGVATLIFASTTIFVTLQESLNNVWNLKTKAKNGMLKLAMDRVLSFGMILSVAFLLLVSLVISALLGVLTEYLQRLLPGIAIFFIYLLDVVVSMGFITLLFALIYKYLPDAVIRWKDVWVGAMVTAFLFLLGKYLIGWYIGQSDMGSTYGAAGSIIILLTWIYYSSLIIFFGAEVTQQYAEKFGQPIIPDQNSVRIEVREVPYPDSVEAKAGRPPAQGRFKS